MDLIEIGLFIKERRNAKKLTQQDLANKLNLSYKTISRWECGLGLPDVSVMIPLCKILNISVTELLTGSIINEDDYIEKTEKELLELTRQNEENNKRLLFSEVLIAIATVVIIVGSVLVASFVKMDTIWRIVIIVCSLLIGLPLFSYCMLIEQKAGYYKCPECGEVYVPTFKQVFFSCHYGRSRFIKCPNCKHKHWQKKVLKK